MKWMQSDHDKQMAFNRWFYYTDDEQSVLGSVLEVAPLFAGYEAPEASEADDWLWEIFGEVDEQTAPEGYSDPYQDDGFAPTMDVAKHLVEVGVALDKRV